VHVKIDKTRREIISGKINNLVAARLRLLTNPVGKIKRPFVKIMFA